MSIEAQLRACCDGCGDYLQRWRDLLEHNDTWRQSRLRDDGALFESETEATQALASARWYVDAKIVLCPGCYLCALEWHAMWTETVSGHPGAVGQDRGVSTDRCTYCGNRAVRRLADRPVCSAHATRRGE